MAYPNPGTMATKVQAKEKRTCVLRVLYTPSEAAWIIAQARKKGLPKAVYVRMLSLADTRKGA